MIKNEDNVRNELPVRQNKAQRLALHEEAVRRDRDDAVKKDKENDVDPEVEARKENTIIQRREQDHVEER
ncbi:MAG: hypothetical protein IJU50_06745 [Lachnospiraceae bacterium]|nr:hypothetical protein [Lachnospiraceae bacterium]